MKKVILIIAFFLSFLYSDEMKFDFDGFEPSGIDMDNKGNLVIVSDEGAVAILDNNGKITSVEFDDRDFEGVTFNKDFSKIYVAEEGKDNILEINMKGEILNIYDVDRTYNDKNVLKKGGDGIEGLTFYKETKDYLYFFISNQSDYIKGEDQSAIMLIKVDKVIKEGLIVKYFPMKIPDISGLFYNKNRIFFISDEEDKLYVADMNLNIIEKVKLEGDAQEGITIDFVNKNIYIADDEGYIIRQKF